jgi:hypothetical protein
VTKPSMATSLRIGVQPEACALSALGNGLATETFDECTIFATCAAIATTISVAQSQFLNTTTFAPARWSLERFCPAERQSKTVRQAGRVQGQGPQFARSLFFYPLLRYLGRASAMFCSTPRNTIASMLSMHSGLMTHRGWHISFLERKKEAQSPSHYSTHSMRVM